MLMSASPQTIHSSFLFLKMVTQCCAGWLLLVILLLQPSSFGIIDLYHHTQLYSYPLIVFVQFEA
jgi:hypothetical protein